MKNKIYILDNTIFYLLIGYICSINFEAKITDILFSVIFILSCIRFYYKKPEWKKIPKTIIYPIGILCIVLLILVCNSSTQDIQESFKIVRRFIKSILPCFIIFYCIEDKYKVKILFLFLLGSIFIEIIYALIMNINNFYDVLFNNKQIRIQGYNVQNWPLFMLFSMKLEIFLPIMYILLLIQKKVINKVIMFIPLLIGIIALFFNNTRMAWLIIALMFIIISYLCIKNKKILITVLFSMSVISLGIVYTQPWIQQRIDNTLYMKDGSSQLHYMFVQDSLEMIKEKPILGWGIGQFSKYYNESFRSDKTNELIERYHEKTPVPYAHNMIIDFLVEGGIIGTLAYIISYGSLLIFSFIDWYKYKSISGLMFFCIILCFILHGFSEKTFSFRTIIQYQYCLLGMYLVYRKYEIKEKELK